MKLPISGQLWRLLANPPYKHPLYRRSAVPRVGPEWLRGVTGLLSPAAPALYLVLISFACLSIASGSVALLLILAALAIFVFNGTYYGMGWTLRIAGELAAERERKAYDLLCLLPGGALGLVQAVAAGVMHREYAFRKRYERHRGLLIGILVFLLALSLVGLFGRGGIDGEIVVMYALIFGVLGASYADFVQSVVLSALVGVFAGHYTVRRLDSELWALLLFLALQLGIYTFAIIAGFVVLPPLVDLTGLPGWQRELLLVVLRFAALVGTRELVVSLFWRLLAKRLNVPAGQLDALRAAT